MKFAVFVVLSCVSLCIVHSVTVTSWGNPTGRIMGYKNITEKSSMFNKKPKNVTFTFPQGKSFDIIRGIKHLDFKSHPSTVRFLKGSVGARNVTISVQSQHGHGIHSSFIFYTN